MSKALNPFALSGNSPPNYADQKIFDKIQNFESAITNLQNESSAFNKIALEIKRDLKGTLTPKWIVNYDSHSESNYESSLNKAKHYADQDAIDTQITLNHVPKTLSEINQAHSLLVEVKTLAKHFRVNIGVIYNLIKTEPDLPYINVGLKKKYMIDVAKFEVWLNERTKMQKHDHFSIPSTVDLMKAFKAKNNGV